MIKIFFRLLIEALGENLVAPGVSGVSVILGKAGYWRAPWFTKLLAFFISVSEMRSLPRPRELVARTLLRALSLSIHQVTLCEFLMPYFASRWSWGVRDHVGPGSVYFRVSAGGLTTFISAVPASLPPGLRLFSFLFFFPTLWKLLWISHSFKIIHF